MIARVHGEVAGFSERGVYVRVGGIELEVLLTAADRQQLGGMAAGQALALHTLFSLEGGGGSLTPILIGFQKERDRDFFQMFLRVEGIGVMNALRILSVPIPSVARAIEEQNIAFLSRLKQVGPRTARKMIAALMGKLGAFIQEDSGELPAGESPEAAGQEAAAGSSGREPMEEWREETLLVLEQLGYSPAEARRLLEKVVLPANRQLTIEEVLAQIYQGNKEGGQL